MNLSNLKFTLTNKGLSLITGKSTKVVTYRKKTRPINQERVNALKSGGWSDQDIKRMMSYKPKTRMASDGGYMYI